MDGGGHAVYTAKWCATILGRYVSFGILLNTIDIFILCGCALSFICLQFRNTAGNF